MPAVQFDSVTVQNCGLKLPLFAGGHLARKYIAFIIGASGRKNLRRLRTIGEWMRNLWNVRNAEEDYTRYACCIIVPSGRMASPVITATKQMEQSERKTSTLRKVSFSVRIVIFRLNLFIKSS